MAMAGPPSKLQSLHEAISAPMFDPAIVNGILDKLLTEVCSRKPQPPPANGDWTKCMLNCCKMLNNSTPLLLAKCANILQVLIRAHHMRLTKIEIDLIVTWICQNLKESPDIVFLDFLQLLEVLMKNEIEYFSTENQELLETLTSKLEEKASVSLPHDVRIWRIACMTTMSKCAPSSCIPIIAASYIDIAFSLKTSEENQSSCLTWLKVIEGLELLFSLSPDWIQPVLQHLVVVIHTAMTTGLVVPPPPTLQFPAHMNMPLPAQLPPAKFVVKIKKKSKGKIKPVIWPENDHRFGDNNRVVIETTPWVSSSDSEFSDSETDKTKHIKRQQAHVRHAAYNLFIHLIKIVGCKSISDWYCAFFSRLIDAVHTETYGKPRCAVYGALATLLSGSKILLGQAQQNQGKSFTSFSEVLADQLSALHTGIIRSLKTIPHSDGQQMSSLFLTTSALIKVTPYSRLQPGLFESLIACIQSFTESKDQYVVTCVLQCMLEVVTLPLSPNGSPVLVIPVESDNSKMWLLDYALSYVDDDANCIRVYAWAVISGLCQSHFEQIEKEIPIIENKILSDIASEKPIVPPLKALANLLDKYLCNSSYVNRSSDIWDILLKNDSPFIKAIQDPGKCAGVACDCLSLIGARKFHMLPENTKIFIITMVFGCCCSELPPVRNAALNTISVFLSYPQMSGEIQFLCDSKDHLIRALKDPIEFVRVRAAWSFSNLIALLVESQDEDLLSEISLYELVKAALTISKDTQKVKKNILRGLGHIFLLVSSEDIEQPKWKDALEQGCSMLQQCSSTGSLMKMRWNACHAIAAMLSNEQLYDALNLLIPSLLKCLCTIVTGCSNFKVRMNACSALSSIKQRKLYGTLFFLVWQSLLDGLENAANMPDFSEFKHQNGLLENLCCAICHMISFIQPCDLMELEEILNGRLSFLSLHLKQCQERITPEQAGALLSATNHIESLIKGSPKNIFAKNLLKSFQEAQLNAMQTNPDFMN